MGKYNGFLSDDDHRDIVDRVDKIKPVEREPIKQPMRQPVREPAINKELFEELDKVRKMDEKNPLEQARKFHRIKLNPPKRGYMQIDAEFLTRSRDDYG